jgi:monovalent cation:H+ antiporter-2, CPA2 family
VTGFLPQALVFLTAAVICVPLARRLGMSSVLGYLIAGVAIGPFVLRFVGDEGSDIMHAAEFGVVMMLFLVGLELEPATFWRMRRMIFGAGTAQLLATALVVSAISSSFLTWRAAIAAGLTVAMSSTAIALQSLKERGEMGSEAGRTSFAVLLFQDIAVIPILALLPLLATVAPAAGASEGSLFHDAPGWLRTVAVLAAVAAVVALGRFLFVPLLRIVARTHLRELFTASALLIVVAITLLMQSVGLSPALGTFLAGVILATSEFKHELESDLDPFKGLLLGLFFIAVGASIDFALIASQPIRIAAWTLGIVGLKLAVLFTIGKLRGLSTAANLTFAIGLSQIGEFAFVLFAFLQQIAITDGPLTSTMIAVTALSMAITPLLAVLNERVLQPRAGRSRRNERNADAIDQKHRVIIAGFSHFGSTVGRFLRANGVEATILDNDSNRVELLRRMGFKVFYGDATRTDLLESAGAHEADILISAVDGPEVQRALIETVERHFPNLELLVRTRHRFHAFELMDVSPRSKIYREHLDTSIRMGVDVLRILGHRAHTAHRAGQKFRQYDEEAMLDLARHRRDTSRYIESARTQIALQEELLRADLEQDPSEGDHAWDSDALRRPRPDPA